MFWKSNQKSAQEIRAQEQAKLEFALQLVESETRQREVIRYECQMFYDQHAEAVKHRYSSQRFKAYLDEWMNDSIPVHLVQERAETLKQMIQGFIEPEEPANVPLTSNEINSYFETIVHEIEQRTIDQDTKESMLAEAYYAQERALRTGRLD